MSQKQYNRIKIVLVEKNITSKALAEGINKDKATVSRWCTNQGQPTVETLFLIADFLDVNVRELLVDSKK